MGPRASPHRSILHVDMDAFYAAVEILHEPSLEGRAVVVGGAGNRGVVAASSYVARAYGVRSAMPSARARRLCPQAVFLPGRFDLYGDYSRRLHEILLSVTPLVEGIALDEAFLDVTAARRLWGPPADIGRRIRVRVHDDMGLWASVGAASTKLVAKLASEAAKPTPSLQGPVPGLGVKVLEPEEEEAFLHAHPVGALWGVGPATRRRLERFGVQTVGDLAALPVEALVGALGQAAGRGLHDLAHNRDDRAVEPDRAVKSVGHEETYARDHHGREPLRREVIRLADAVATRLRRQGMAARTVTLKVRFGDFRTITRSRTVADAVDSGPVLARVALPLLEAVDLTPGVRLLGVSGSGLVAVEAHQLAFDGSAPADDPAGAVAQAIDDVRRRFGDRAVGPATLLGPGGLGIRRRGDQQWGPGT